MVNYWCWLLLHTTLIVGAIVHLFGEPLPIIVMAALVIAINAMGAVTAMESIKLIKRLRRRE